MDTSADHLRRLLSEPQLRIVPCCFDALSARLVREAGFPLTFLSGFSASAARLGLPDTGLISFAEMADQLRCICEAEPEMLVIGDGDTGFGNALNVKRTVRAYARAGAAAIMIEDQESPKRCGHTQGKRVIGRGEARAKVRAAVDAAREGRNSILVLARTDARATLGFEAALERCQDFVEEGADIVFLEAPATVEEMRRFAGSIPRPTMANMVRGGMTPLASVDDLEEMGFRLAAYPVTLLSASIAAQREALRALRSGQEQSVRQVDFATLKSLVGFDAYQAAENHYRAMD